MAENLHFNLFGTSYKSVLGELFVGDQGNQVIDAVKFAIRMIAIVKLFVERLQVNMFPECRGP